ncbi:hypothetical protein GCM10018771_01380 [Streptomyces cellulosae]|nr:hypothetical protein GCM10018771_01380 [Streptomyces cellulosae]
MAGVVLGVVPQDHGDGPVTLQQGILVRHDVDSRVLLDHGHRWAPHAASYARQGIHGLQALYPPLSIVHPNRNPRFRAAYITDEVTEGPGET